MPTVRSQGTLAMMRELWERWKWLARKIGDVQARAMMAVFYFVILGPIALATNWRRDLLAIKAATPRGWIDIEQKEVAALEQSSRQY